jgi:hypothetical protein
MCYHTATVTLIHTTGLFLDSIIPLKEMSRLNYSGERNVSSPCNIIYSVKSELLVSIPGRVSTANDRMKVKLSQLCLNIKSMPKTARVVSTARKPLQSMSGSSSTALAKSGLLKSSSNRSIFRIFSNTQRNTIKTLDPVQCCLPLAYTVSPLVRYDSIRSY